MTNKTPHHKRPTHAQQSDGELKPNDSTPASAGNKITLTCTVLIILSTIAFAIMYFNYEPYIIADMGILPAELHQISKVIDGDTVKLNNGKTVRLAGLDAPEMNYKPNNENINADPECYAIRAREALKKVTNSSTQVFISPKPIGKHGRYIGYLISQPDRMDINAWMVKQGYATSYWTDQYVNEQKAAELNDKGLHKHCNNN